MKTKLIALLFVGIVALAADNPFVGEWKLNVAK